MKIMVYAVYSNIKHQNSGFKKNLTLFSIEHIRGLYLQYKLYLHIVSLKPCLGYLDEF